MREFTIGRNPRGMSRFEVLVSAIIVAVFATLLLQRLLYYQEQMEKVDMESMAKQLDSLLRIRGGELMLAGRSADLAALDGSNPFDLFEVAPPQFERNAGSDSSGVWRYDRASGELRYRPGNRRHLTLLKGAGEGGSIRYRAELLRVAPDGHTAGVRLRALTEYRWFD